MPREDIVSAREKREILGRNAVFKITYLGKSMGIDNYRIRVGNDLYFIKLFIP